MQVTVENLQKSQSLNLPQIVRIAKAILRYEGVCRADLSIVFVTASKIRALNEKFLGRRYATDVLAFDLGDGVCGRWTRDSSGEREISAEIVISVDAAIQNARIYRVPFAEELILYVIHGILHLLGYDDHASDDIRKMRRQQRQILKYLKLKFRWDRIAHDP